MILKRSLGLCFLAAGIAGASSWVEGGDYVHYGGVTGTLGIESANPQEANQKASEILARYQASITGSNAYKDPKVNKQQITLQASVKSDQLNQIMNELAALGKVTARNIYDQSGLAKGAMPEKELAEIDQEIRRLRIGLLDHPNVANVLQKHRQTLISQIKAKEAGKGAATLSLTIKDENYSQAYQAAYNNRLPEGNTVQAKAPESEGASFFKGILLPMVLGAAFLLAGLAGGFLAARRLPLT